MATRQPGKAHREGITLVQLTEMFPDEDAARRWFEAAVWPEGRHCPRCGSERTHEASHAKCPYRCSDCRSYFSVKTGTAMEASRLPLRKWVFAIYLELTSLKGVSSLKLHRDIGVTQKTAWFLLHRIREAWASETGDRLPGPVEVDETFVGGKRKNMSPRRRRSQPRGRGYAGKAAVAGVKDRESRRVSAAVVERTDRHTLRRFIADRVEIGAKVYTDDNLAYRNLGVAGFEHEAVRHSAGEYVREMAHTNGIESFWAMLKRGYNGTYHHMSEKHLQRYVNEFSGRHNIRDLDTADQMLSVAAGLVGRRLMYRNLTAR